MQIRTQVYCFFMFLAILLTASLVHSQASGEEQGQPNADASFDAAAFQAAVSEFFQVPTEDVKGMLASGIEPAEVVVVHFLARQSMRTPAEVVAERRSGKPWREIAQAASLEPERFYYPLPNAARKPFVNVYALFQQQPRSEWSWQSLPLGDEDIEDLVCLRFLSELENSDTPAAASLRNSSQGSELVNVHHYLLSGQSTASVANRAAGAVRS